jgi:plasmid maintenance system antidote protein VapI
MNVQDPIVFILAAIEKKKLTQSQAAKKIGMLKSQFNETMKGKRKISPRVAFRIEDSLGVRADMILRLQLEKEIQQLKQVRKLISK